MKDIKSHVRDFGALAALCVVVFIIHMIANANYGFHRDELQFISDSRHLSAGFVAYPPVTPLMAALARTLFGESLVAYRVFSAVAHALIVLLAGLMARELGGKTFSVVFSALLSLASPVLLFSGSVIMYMIFDYLSWAGTAYFLLRVLRGSSRSWIGVGISVGFGMMTKYSIAFGVLAMILSLLALPERKAFRTGYFPLAVAIALAMFLPNFVWLVKNDFVYLDFIRAIHERDIRWGRTEGFFMDQISDCIGYGAVPFAAIGTVFLVVKRSLARFRAASLWVAITIILFIAMKGRGYYAGALYLPLTAAGAVAAEAFLVSRFSAFARAALRSSLAALFAINAVVTSVLALPLAPVGSDWFYLIASLNESYPEQFGWEELASDVASIRDSLPESERAQFGVYAGNYGEAGALEFYGRAYGLPKIMCGTNSFYDRGYDESEPQVVVVAGVPRERLVEMFESVEVAARARNALGVQNEETRFFPEIYLCKNPTFRWSEFWKTNRRFG